MIGVLEWRMNISEYEAIVLGAGPAGSGVAKLLAEWGHRVLLIDRPPVHPRGLAISMPPSTQRTFAALGMLDAVVAAGFHEWRGNTVWWAEEEPRVERFPDTARGHHVLRASLSDVLRPLAIHAGADLREGHIRDVKLAEDSPVTVTINSGDHEWQARARIALDCTGRSGIIARQGLRQLETSHRTVALVGQWRSECGWGSVDDTHTLVAAYEDGWAWSIPTAAGVRYFTVMVDPERTQLARGYSADVVYLAELAKLDVLRSLLERGRLTEGPWGHDSTCTRLAVTQVLRSCWSAMPRRSSIRSRRSASRRHWHPRGFPRSSRTPRSSGPGCATRRSRSTSGASERSTPAIAPSRPVSLPPPVNPITRSGLPARRLSRRSRVMQISTPRPSRTILRSHERSTSFAAGLKSGYAVARRSGSRHAR